jgi:hypothetical protein
MNEKTFVIFYAWQSDLDEDRNKRLIRRCLKLANIELEKLLYQETGVEHHIVIDEATRNVSGSPNIPNTIIEKIMRADIFVGDLSSINDDQPAESKRTPNPNVTFELGFAASQVGWNRIIMLVNEAYGVVSHLPFDFDRHRASTFKSNGDGNTEKYLTNLLVTAVGSIIRANPPKPGAKVFNTEQAKRDRDICNLTWFLESVNWVVIDEHINSGAKYLTTVSAFMRDAAAAVFTSSRFHLYDSEVRDAVDKFLEHWNDSMRHDHYVPSSSGRLLMFKYSIYATEIEKEEAEYKYMDAERGKLRSATDTLLALIRNKYPEIDIRALSDAAIDRYND